MRKAFFYEFARLAIRLLIAIHRHEFRDDVDNDAMAWLEKTK